MLGEDRFGRQAVMTSSETSGKIVVGVDGSEHSRRALAWALSEARLRHVACVLIHAWTYGLVTSGPFPGDAPQVLAEDAKELLARDMAFASDSGVPIKGVLSFGSASRALIEASHDALLLVVGSHGRGALARALLGSVATACVHHATCPVVVINPEDRSTLRATMKGEPAEVS
jgi:nucleotide-binding universal stress UspA family protein